MSKNTNTLEKIQSSLSTTAAEIGTVMMMLATVAGMAEMPDHSSTKFILPGQVSLAMAEDSELANNPMRRERDESAPHYLSYSVAQRTPGRSAGK